MYDFELLKREFEKKTWSQAEWAERAGVPVATAYQLLKRGTGRKKTIAKLAKPLGLKLEDLLPKMKRTA